MRKLILSALLSLAGCTYYGTEGDPTCCAVCSVGQPCGDACISQSYTCHIATGCACYARETPRGGECTVTEVPGGHIIRCPDGSSAFVPSGPTDTTITVSEATQAQCPLGGVVATCSNGKVFVICSDGAPMTVNITPNDCK